MNSRSMLPWSVLQLTVVLTFGGLVVVLGPVASGRPRYSKVFFERYPDNPEVGKLAGGAKCSVCHGAAKKARNDYGSAFGELLPAKNEMNADAINKALKAVEGQPSGTAGKTFGDLLKDGKLPGK